MSDEQALRTLARAAMETDRLPKHCPERMWGGPGGGASCALCGKTIGKEEMEFELQFSSNEDPGSGNHHFHVRCFAAWELERRSGDPNGHSLPRAESGGIMPSCERDATGQGDEG